MDSNSYSRKSIILILFLPLFLFSGKWEDAKKAYSIGEFSDAFKIYIQIAQESESFQEKAQAYLYAAWCKYTMGEKEEMKNYIKKAIDEWADIQIEEELFNEEFNENFKIIKGEKIPIFLPEEKDAISNKIEELNLLLINKRYKECINASKQTSQTLKYKQVYKILGDCFLMQNQINDALENYRIAQKLPLFIKEEKTILTPEEQLKKARSLYRRGEKKQALQILNSLVYSYNPPAEVFGFSGLILLEENLYFEAEKVLSQGLLLNSGNPLYYNLYGVALYAQGKYAEAIKLFQQAISSDKFLSPALGNLASSYAQFKELSAAETYFSQAILLDPTNAFYLSEYGKTLLLLGKYKEASNKFSEAIKYEKYPTQLYYFRGLAYLFDKNYESSFKDLDNYLSKRSDDLKAIEFYGVLLKEQNQCSKAIEYLKKSKSDFAKRALAQCYLFENKPSEAVEILTKLEENVQVLNDLSAAYLMLGDYTKAYECINKIPQNRRVGKILENIERVNKIFNARFAFGLK